MFCAIMRRSNRNFNTPPPPPTTSRANLGHLTIFLCSGRGGFDLCMGGVVKIEQEVSGNFFFSRASKLPKTKHTCLDEFKGRDIAISQVNGSKEFWLRNSSLSYYRVKTVWYVFSPPSHCYSCTFLLEIINRHRTI